MSQAGGTLAVTTYQAGKVLLVGWNGRQVSLLPRNFDKPMGMANKGNAIALALRNEVMVFGNAPQLAHDYLPKQPGRYDALFLPRMTYHTGEINIHDLVYGTDRLWAVNTRFSCIGNLSAEYTFTPTWKPSFISEMFPEDRCHLNGLAMLDGMPSVVTVLGETDTPGGWRPNKATGGAIVDIVSNEILVRGLSMPHSPRWHDGILWFLNSGTGELCIAKPETGKYETACSLPGYLRGLYMTSTHALIGMSMIREKHIFGGLPIQQQYEQLQCGVAVIDLRSGKRTGMLEFTGGATELYDVQFLAGVQRPNLLNLEKKETTYAYTSPRKSYWLRPEYFKDAHHE